MVNIKWCESPNDGDCLDDGEWDIMVAYIKHDAVVDFTIHTSEGTCADTGQAFKFSVAAAVSKMYGGSDAADEMQIICNSNDTYPYIEMFGGAGMELEVASEEAIYFKDGAEQFFMFYRDATVSNLVGSDDADDDLRISANFNDTYPFLLLEGNAGATLNVASEEAIYFKDDTEQFFMFYRDAAVSNFIGSDDTGDALKISANSTDSYPFIQLEGDDYIELDTTNYIYFKEQGEQMFLFDHTSPTSFLYGSDDAGDDLSILANTNDDCSLITLYGDGRIRNEIKVAFAFEVATCSDEMLFKIDSGAGHHYLDLYCLDAHNFVLENRTDDPGTPCTGQMWFRTDI